MLLIQKENGKKITDWVDPSDSTGEFKRGGSAFREFISKKPGAEFPPEKGRYHLYVSYACPWGQYSRNPGDCYRANAGGSPPDPYRSQAQGSRGVHSLH